MKFLINLDQENEDNSGNLEIKFLGNIEFKNVDFLMILAD
jgi:hypothetical protein